MQAPSLGETSYALMEALLFGESWGLDREMLAAYESLRPDHQLGILSNHHRGVRQVLESQGIAALFHDIVISAEVKVAKPNEAAFRLALERLGTNANETVFIDDNADNVWTARSIGMTAIEHISTGTTLASLRGLFPGLGAP
jgi:putative hydrolase of the HAD superfamily